MKKSSSRSSLYSQPLPHRPTPEPPRSRIDPLQLAQDFQAALLRASQHLSFDHFAPLYEELTRTIIRRAESQNAQAQAVFSQAIKASLEAYGGSLELRVRGLLLEALVELNSGQLQEVGMKLEKAKHFVVDTEAEYLLSKVFLLEERLHLSRGDESTALKSLKKCLELNERHMVQFLNHGEDIRKELADHAVIAYYQSYRLRKSNKHSQALENLSRAYTAAKHNFGPASSITRALQEQYNQQQITSAERSNSGKSRAITDIVEIEGKKGYRTVATYCWEEERIVVQLLKGRDVVSEATYEIKLDIGKIKQLRGGEWLSVDRGQVTITEDELLRLLGVNSAPSHKEMTTRIEMRNISREEVIRRSNVSSSSDDNSDFFEKDEFKFMKIGRAQSSKKFKETH